MSVHAVEIVCSKSQRSNPDFVPSPEPPSLPGVAHDRVKQHIKYNFNPVLEDQDSPMGLRKAGEMTGFDVDHARGRYRFDSVDDKKSLLDSIESKVVTDAEWYEVRYHECDHDESNGSGCPGFKTVRSYGTVPDGV